MASAADGDMQFHEAANIYPLDDETLPELANDIRDNGQLLDIEILDGKVLDGRRRWLACKMAGKKPRTVTVTVDDPIARVVSLNSKRRHMTPSELSMVAARVRQLYDAQAKERMHAGKRNPVVTVPQGKSRDLAGKAIGVSGSLVDKATKVLHKGTPELIAAVEGGRLSVSSAAELAEADEATQKYVAAQAHVSGGRYRKPKTEVDVKNASNREGVGVTRANEAINCLTRIPKNDPLRKRGFQIVTDWIRKNR